jgi:cyclopropane fatty-acyl-phospholipid synthase-like methyltransferase
MPLVSHYYLLLPLWLNCNDTDYPRTLREWGRRLEANLSQGLIAKDHPSLKDRADYEAFKRKWHYQFAYAEAGFVQGYITCHMLTFIRDVSAFHTFVIRWIC